MRAMATSKGFINEVSKHLAGFARKGRLLLRVPVEQMLQGIYFDSSSFSKGILYPTAFVQPLFVPRTHLIFTFGGRLSGNEGRGWDLESATKPELLVGEVVKSIETQAIPLFDTVREPIDLAVGTEHFPPELPSEFRWPGNDINVLEAAAYAWFLAGDSSQSRLTIERLEAQFHKEQYDAEWALDLFSRVQQFKKLLPDSSIAIQYLSNFRLQTAAALGIEDCLAKP